MSQYRSLDRGTQSAAFLASLLIATAIFGSVLTAFGHVAPRLPAADHIEEVVVQG